MKVKVNEATVETSLGLGKSVEMGFSKKNIGKLMFLMSNLYNDPETAVIREYFTNGWDAHKKVGQTKPVQVYLPTRDNPLYVVKDEGVGMTEHDMEFVYSQYGESTKEETNDESGFFGLGCKAGLAINPQFTVTSVKDGVKTTAIVSNSPTGANKLDILPSKATDEPNGTTVTIPVTNITDFNDKAVKFFQYVKPGDVMVNGQQPKYILEDAKEIELGVPGTTAHVKEMGKYNYGTPTFKVIMGNVPYTLSQDVINDSFRRQNLTFDTAQSKLHAFFTVSIGDVELTGAREGIRMTDETKEKIDEILKAYVESIRKTAQDEIDAVERREAVFEVFDKWSNIVGKAGAQWRGQPIPDLVRFVGAKSFKVVKRSGPDSTHTTGSSISPREKATIVSGTDLDHYRKVALYLTPYMDEVGVTRQNFYFTDEDASITDPWLRDNANITFTTAEKVVEIGKAKRKADRDAKRKALGTSPNAGKVRYVVMELATGRLKSVVFNEIPQGTPYMDLGGFYSAIEDLFLPFTTGRKSLDDYHTASKRAAFGKSLAHFTSAKEVILVGRPRKASAVADRVKGAYNVLEDINRVVKGTFDSVPQRVKDIESLQHSDLKNLIARIKNAKLETTVRDRDLRRLINPTKRAKETHKRLSEYKKHIQVIKPHIGSVEIPDTSNAVQTLMDRYPLIEAISFGRMDARSTEHIVTYINAVHDQSLTPTS